MPQCVRARGARRANADTERNARARRYAGGQAVTLGLGGPGSYGVARAIEVHAQIHRRRARVAPGDTADVGPTSPVNPK